MALPDPGEKDSRILQNFYWEQEAELKIDTECTEFKPMLLYCGVRQGFLLLPDIHNIYSKMMLHNISEYDRVNVIDRNLHKGRGSSVRKARDSW